MGFRLVVVVLFPHFASQKQQMTPPDFSWVGYMLLAIMVLAALLLVFLLTVVRKKLR